MNLPVIHLNLKQLLSVHPAQTVLCLAACVCFKSKTYMKSSHRGVLAFTGFVFVCLAKLRGIKTGKLQMFVDRC